MNGGTRHYFMGRSVASAASLVYAFKNSITHNPPRRASRQLRRSNGGRAQRTVTLKRVSLQTEGGKMMSSRSDR